MLYQFESNGLRPITRQRLRIYAEFPLSYDSVSAMTDHLDSIAAQKFNIVWLNPFAQACERNALMEDHNPKLAHFKGCPYATKAPYTLDKRMKGSMIELQDYTNQAKAKGITPLFDLVLNHVALDHPLLANCFHPQVPADIDTSLWFKRHQNGNLVIQGLDENYQQLDDDDSPWADIARFEYDDPNIAEQIFEYYWKPYIDYMVDDLGFMGARLDAVAHVPRQAHKQILAYLKDKVKSKHDAEAILLAETFCSYGVDGDMCVKDLASHTMNPGFWAPRRDEDGHRDFWMNDTNWCAHNKGTLQKVGPSLGHFGSHDTKRLAGMLLEKSPALTPEALKKEVLYKMMEVAFSSDGGLIMQTGDEQGLLEQQTLFNPVKGRDAKRIDINLVDEIRMINELVEQLPPPSQPEWTQRVFDDEHPDIVIFIIHQGLGFESEPLLLIGNVDAQQPVTLDQDSINRYMTANGRNNEHWQPAKTVYTAGAITVNAATPIVSVKTKEALSPPAPTLSD